MVHTPHTIYRFHQNMELLKCIAEIFTCSVYMQNDYNRNKSLQHRRKTVLKRELTQQKNAVLVAPDPNSKYPPHFHLK